MTKNYFKVLSYILYTTSLLVILNACSISNGASSASDSAGSMAKSSDSISGSSTSSSNSSENDSKASRYSHETQEFTATYLGENRELIDHTGFMKGISLVAAQNGIVDWEALPQTYHAIGMGLKKINLSKNQYEYYKKQFTDNNNVKMAQIQQGYQH